jgi:hypothetical protein
MRLIGWQFDPPTARTTHLRVDSRVRGTASTLDDPCGREDLHSVANGGDLLAANCRANCRTFSFRRRYSGALPPGSTRAS